MEDEILKLIDEIGKTVVGRDALISSAEIIEKYPFPELPLIQYIAGCELPIGIPFKL